MRKVTISNQPLLTVCLITYNHSVYIKEAIEGVLKQKVEFSWHFVIADDHSTDGTRKILIEYKEKYPSFITLILQKKNKGASENWIDLVSFPKSKYIAYLEGDDYWTDETKLQKQVDFMERNPDCSLHFHNVLRYHEATDTFEISGNSNRNIKPFNPGLEDMLNSRVGIASCSWLIRRDKLFLPSWLSECAMGDWPVIFFLANAGMLHYSPDIMGVYRKHEGGASISIGNGKLELIKVLKFFKKDIPKWSNIVNSKIGILYLEVSAIEKNTKQNLNKHLGYLLKALFYRPSLIFTNKRSIVYLLLPVRLAKLFRRKINNSAT